MTEQAPPTRPERPSSGANHPPPPHPNLGMREMVNPADRALIVEWGHANLNEEAG